MKAKRLCLLAAACVVLCLSPALAGAEGPNYIAIRGGAGWAPDVDRSAGSRTATVEFGAPFGFGAAYGRRVASWLRLEGELSYFEAKVDRITGHFGQETNASGRDRFLTFMVNALADINNPTDFTPFVGLGIGAVRAHHDVTFSPMQGMPAAESDHHDWAFGYQFMAGLAWDFSPALSLDLMYRFLGIGSRDHEQSNTPFGDVEMDASQMHLLLLGLRFAF
ncbi:MAG: outer membrane beta-barrel protein [Desulfarculaceae bacterium]|jgi:opacity protein-like surface antigen